jgi:hypothetical protein
VAITADQVPPLDDYRRHRPPLFNDAILMTIQESGPTFIAFALYRFCRYLCRILILMRILINNDYFDIL